MRKMRRDGFSLMELLVVIAVIAILVGLLFPALLTVRERARENRARAEVHELQKAWQMYFTTYDEFPASGQVEMNSELTQTLGGDNPNNIAFMEFSDRELSEGFRDPWGEPYRVEFIDEEDVEMEAAFQSRVHCVNAKRYQY